MTEVDSAPRGHPGPMQSEDPDRELELVLQQQSTHNVQDVPARSHTPSGPSSNQLYPTSFPAPQPVDEHEDPDRFSWPVPVATRTGPVNELDSGDEADFDEEMTADQRMAMKELRDMRLDLNYAEDPPDYDVRERVRQLNEELAKVPSPTEHERAIKFQENPVSLVVPPPEYPSDEEAEPASTPASTPAANTASSEPSPAQTMEEEDLDMSQELAEPQSVSRQNSMNDRRPEHMQGDEEEEEEVESLGSEEGGKGDRVEAHQERGGSDKGSDKDSDAGSDKSDSSPAGNGDSRVDNDDEKVLVERNNKFELVSINSLSAEERQLYLPSAQEDTKDSGSASSKASSNHSKSSSSGLTPQPPPHPRPATATHARTSPANNNKRERRAQSAKQTRTQSAHSQNLSTWDENDFNYRSPYALSDSEKKQLARQKREKEEKKCQQEQEEKQKTEREKEDADDFFQSWLKQKRREASLRRKEEKRQQKHEQQQKENEDENGSESDTSSKREPEEPFQSWLQVKNKERQRTRSVERAIRREQQEQFSVRPRNECDKAFNAWLSKKNSELRRQKQEELQRNRVARLMARRSRKSQQLARAMSHANTFKYVDYYGYRF